MKAFAITNKGTEEICAAEINELIKTKTEVKEKIVIFDAGSYEDICKLIYLGQSISKVALFLGHFQFKDDFFEQLEASIKKSDINNWLHEGLSFKAECIRHGEHDFSSIDVVPKIGEAILSCSKHSIKVDLKNPDLQIFAFVTGEGCYYGIDFAGIDLSTRDYKIFSHRESLNGTIAYSLVRLSEWDRKKILIDPFCGSATIPIEASIWQTGFPLNYYRKEKLVFKKMDLGFDQKKFFEDLDNKAKFPKKINLFGSDMLLTAVNSSNKNAKIAGIHKGLNLNRIDIDWIDTKFEENSISFMVTNIPEKTKMSNSKYLDKLYTEFWFQADYIMKKKDVVIVIACNTVEDMQKDAEKFKFKLEGQYDFWQGKEKIVVSKFVR